MAEQANTESENAGHESPSKRVDPRKRVSTIAAGTSVWIGLFLANADVPAWLDNLPIAVAAGAAAYSVAYRLETRSAGDTWIPLAVVVFGLLYYAVHLAADPMSESPAFSSSFKGLAVAKGSCVERSAERFPGTSEPVELFPRTSSRSPGGTPLATTTTSRSLKDIFTTTTSFRVGLPSTTTPQRTFRTAHSSSVGGRDSSAWTWQLNRLAGRDMTSYVASDACDQARTYRLLGAGLAALLLVAVFRLGDDAFGALMDVFRSG